MRKLLQVLAIVAPFAAFTPVVHALDLTSGALPSLVATTTGFSQTFTFTNFTWTEVQFSLLTGVAAGSLTSVSVNATLNASAVFTYANDLTVYITPTPALVTLGLLQVGGGTDLGADQSYSWQNGSSPLPGTTVIDTVSLATPIDLPGPDGLARVWIGNGYAGAGTSGTWTGFVTLNFAAPVPEPASWALFAAGGLGLVAWAGRRRRAIAG